MHMRVDQPRHDDFVAARRVGGEIAFQLRDAAVGDPDSSAVEPPVVASQQASSIWNFIPIRWSPGAWW
jgi:hypothetical protein